MSSNTIAQTKDTETKFALSKGSKIAYSITGSGPAVILQHGLFGNRIIWEAMGYVEELEKRYTVISIDSLGHGDSDKPTEVERYQRKHRAADVIAVLDAENIARAHYVGYSMGGWIGIGVLTHYPERLISATIGGWDPTPTNPYLPVLREEDASSLLAPLKETSPEFYELLARSVTPLSEPGLTACMRALSNAEISVQQLVDSTIPLHLWIGILDEHYAGVLSAHKRTKSARLTEVEGDHMGALINSGPASVNAIIEFIDEVEDRKD